MSEQRTPGRVASASPASAGPAGAGPAVAIGIVQAAARIDDIDGNLRTLRRGVAEARDGGAEVVVTPELFATGYDPARAWTHDGERVPEGLAGIAGDLGVALVASSVDEVGARRFIAASFFDDSGTELARVHKRHLFDIERDFFTPADRCGDLVDWRGMRFGMGICYDIEYPEFARALAEAGAEVLLVPTAVPASSGDEPRDPALAFSPTQTSTLLVPARALENGLAIAYANHSGEGFTAHSCLVNPNGRIVGLLDRGAGVAVTVISAAEIAEARARNPYLADLRRLRGRGARP